MFIIAPFGGALRDIPKDGCEGDYFLHTSRPIILRSTQVRKGLGKFEEGALL